MRTAELLSTSAVVIALIIIVFGISKIPFHIKRCALTHGKAYLPSAKKCTRLSTVGPVGTIFPCTSDSCVNGYAEPLGTCDGGGRCYRIPVDMFYILTLTTGRMCVFFGVVLILIVTYSIQISRKHQRRWIHQHSYETQSPCNETQLLGNGNFIYDPIIGKASCTDTMVNTPDAMKCVCNDKSTLRDGKECDTSSDCGAGNICMVQRHPCHHIQELHSVHHDTFLENS